MHFVRRCLGATLIVAAAAAVTRADASPMDKADSQMKAVLDQLATLNPEPIVTLPPARARAQPSASDAVIQLLQVKGLVAPDQLPPVGRVDSKAIPVAGGAFVPARVYTPSGKGPFPIIVYFHGGGWVIADTDTYDSSCRAMTSLTEAIVVSVDYRRAPEFKFPTAHEDCYAAFQYVATHTSEFGGINGKVAVAGESAGGNLATGVCLMAAQRGGKMPIHQALVYPITGYDFNTPSYLANADAKPLNKPMMQWFFQQYLNSPADAKSVLAAPLQATPAELKALPPATIVTAELDPLHDDGQMYAAKLRSAGVDVEAKDYAGVTHEFFGMAAAVDKAKSAEAFVAGRLKDALSK